MSILITDCPRCRAQKVTFDVKQAHWIAEKHTWQSWFETFCVCRRCHKSTTFLTSQNTIFNGGSLDAQILVKYDGAANDLVAVESFLSLKDQSSHSTPEFLPEEIEETFREGATCLTIGCYNAAGTMFRKCIDLSTRSMLPQEETEGLTGYIRRNLAPRLHWLFDQKILPEGLRDLSTCIREDGNDGAHHNVSLSKDDTEDLLDFTTSLLERLYTEPARLKEAGERRVKRREKK